jgi:hypothetical protein
MVLSVNSAPSKVVLGFTAVAALGLGTVLFYRYHGNADAQPTPSSLDKGRFSCLADLPLIGHAYNFFNPTKPTELPIPTLNIGSSSKRARSIDDLTSALAKVGDQDQGIGALVIYGHNLNITQDPGILKLKPMKVILVGAQIMSMGGLEKSMMESGWYSDREGVKVIEVASVEQAIKDTQYNLATYKPCPTAYYVAG